MDEIDGEGRWDSGRFGQPQFDFKHLKLCRRNEAMQVSFLVAQGFWWEPKGLQVWKLWSLGTGWLILDGAWRELGGSWEGEVGLQERFGKSRLDFNQPPYEEKWGCAGYILERSYRDHRDPSFIRGEVKLQDRFGSPNCAHHQLQNVALNLL